MSEDTATEVWMRLLSLVERHDRRQRLTGMPGMSFMKAKALRLITQAPMTMHQLSDRLETSRPYITLMVDDLVQRGLVERTEQESDRRRKIVSATAAGRDAAAAAEQTLHRPPAELLAVSPADLADLARITAAFDS